ncbi:hypothetical protein [Actinomycetospora termitidis]|uniref:Gram-positive cocci surface proteins LPxTG domain-containing protein n=1 Tax=Actinomycetospora termitidis TaxID=3053470 RepID=A0ABT7MK50_9PSEU|nr:hypothetical protein [Actinomycetospora sp. Odt1-22]MDL5159733.1 hypothetical protein [Actinomycetospora sp. Odt1-22]
MKLRTIALAGVTALTLTGLGSGLALAQSGPPPVASIPSLTGKSTSVKLDSGFTDALSSLQVTPAPTGSATVEDGTASFPITGGNVTVYKPGEVTPYVQGMIMHDGSGLSLTKGDTKVTLEDFVIDPGQPATLKGKVSANGATVADSVTLFDLDGSTLKPITTDASAGTATLTGTTVKLSTDAADALNKAFSTDALKGGTTVGIATIVVNLPGSDGGSGMPGAMPKGGAETGGGSTATGGVDTTLIAGGVLALAVAGGALVVVRRRAGTRS